MEFNDKVMDQVIGLRMLDMEPRFLILDRGTFEELKHMYDVMPFQYKRPIKGDMFAGLVVAVVETPIPVLEVRQ